MMKKVIIISAEIDYYGKGLGGQGAAVFGLTQALRNRYELMILTLGFKRQSLREHIEGVDVIRIITALTKKCANFQELLSYKPKDIDKVYYDFRRGVLRYFMRQVLDIKDVIVHIHHGWGEGLVCKYLKKMGAKVVVTFHWLRIQRYLRAVFLYDYIDVKYDYNSVTSWQRLLLALNIIKHIFKNEKCFIKFTSLFYRFRSEFILPFKIRLYYESEIEALKFASKVIVVGWRMKNYLCWINCHSISGKKIKVIKNGVDINYFEAPQSDIIENMRQKFNLRKEDVIFLFVGRIDPMKGIEYLFEAMQYIEMNIFDSNRNFKLLIVGEYYGVYGKDYLSYLKALVDRLKRVKILFTGPVYGDEKLALYDLSNIFILPSVYEPFGLVVLEAMAQGKPVIVSSSCGSAEIVKDDFGIVVDYDDPSRRAKNLAEAIMKILHMDLTKMGVAARKEARRHTWSDVIRKYQEIYSIL